VEWSKLKNIIILILLILNLCLLLLAGGRQRQCHVADDELRHSTVAFMEKKGIRVSEDIVPWEKPCFVQTSARDQQEEARLATAILGESQGNTVGIAMEYTGNAGSVRFYPDGRFSVLLSDGDRDTASDMERDALKYMGKLGLDLKLTRANTEGGETRLKFMQLTKGHPVFTCEIEMLYQDGQLRSVKGWRLFGEVSQDTLNQEPMTAPTLLLRFIEAIRMENIPCSEILGITQGYVHSSTSLSAKSTLIPVWRIETDTHIFLLNCMTGKLESTSPLRSE